MQPTPDTKLFASACFTPRLVRTILLGVLKQGNPPGPTEVERLTFTLNQIREFYIRAQAGANDSKKAADQVRTAIETLQRFLDIRRLAWEAPGTPPAIVAAEQELFSKFTAFAAAMQAHPFELDIDAGMPVITDWHHLAFSTATAFRSAMAPRNPGKTFGNTADGPLTRFLAEVLPRITGEPVTPGAASIYLRRKTKDSTGAPPGLVLLTIEECAAAADTQVVSER